MLRAMTEEDGHLLVKGDVPENNCILSAVIYRGEKINVCQYQCNEIKIEGKPSRFFLAGKGWVEIDSGGISLFESFHFPGIAPKYSRCVMEVLYDGKPVFRKFRVALSRMDTIIEDYHGYREFHVWYDNGERLNYSLGVPMHIMLRWSQNYQLSIDDVPLTYEWDATNRTMNLIADNLESSFKLDDRGLAWLCSGFPDSHMHLNEVFRFNARCSMRPSRSGRVVLAIQKPR